MRLNLEQRKSLSTYSGNLSIAWFAAGIIGPIVTRQDLNETWKIIVSSILISGVLLLGMLVLVGEKEKKTKK